MDTPVLVATGCPSPVPLTDGVAHAGFPSPAADHEEGSLDLTQRFVRHPLATFVVRASGDSLVGMGVLPGDYLLVDRSREPHHADVVIAIVDGAFVAKRFVKVHGIIALESANPGYRPIAWKDGCEIFGVVTSVHRDLVAGRG